VLDDSKPYKARAAEVASQLRKEDGCGAALELFKDYFAKSTKEGGGVGGKKLPIFSWQKNAESTTCNDCQSVFGWFPRNGRHHCRGCGKLFCQACVAPTALLNYASPQLVCKACRGCLLAPVPPTDESAAAVTVVDVAVEPEAGQGQQETTK